MHGLLCRSVQGFLVHTYGEALWNAVVSETGLDRQGFEPFAEYDDELVFAVVGGAGRRLGKSCDQIVEDVGAYIVGIERFRRLLRFGGADYEEFLHSIDELPERVRLVVPDLELPELRLRAAGPGRYEVTCVADHWCFCVLLAGILRTMADDYGSLALIEVGPSRRENAIVAIELLDTCFSAGRVFDLALPEVR